MYVRLIETLQYGITVIETESNQEGADLIRSLQVNLPAMSHHRPTLCTPLFIRTLQSSAGMQLFNRLWIVKSDERVRAVGVQVGFY